MATITVNADAARWQRLADDLTTAGLDGIRVDVKRYQGRRTYEFSRSITLQVRAAGRFLGCITVIDATRHGQWFGWTAWIEDADSIVKAELPPTTLRADVVLWVAQRARGR